MNAKELFESLPLGNEAECIRMLEAALSTARIEAGKGNVSASPMPDVEWAVERWHAEVANRPLRNIHRAGLDTAWRQVIRHFGGDPDAMCGPDHYTLVEQNPHLFRETTDAE